MFHPVSSARYIKHLFQMAAPPKILLNYNLKRGICSTMMNYGKNSNLQSRFMRKLMKKDVGKRKWYENKQRVPVNPLETPKLVSIHVTRRRTVLNTLFMKHITDLMATGEASTHLLGRSIEVTHVNITPDFQTVLVYWASSKIADLPQTEKVLNTCAYGLRHELTQLHVIGQVPMIKFVKNKTLASLNELERRFNIADYGEDYEPVYLQPVKKPELTLSVKLPAEVKEKILQLEDEIKEEVDDDWHEDIPPMRHDVLGLNHHALMTRVKVSLNKSREAARNRLFNSSPPSVMDPSISSAVQGFLTAKGDSDAFMEFLRKRQMEERRISRRENREIILEFNDREHEIVPQDYDNDDVFMRPEEKDIDGFEDMNLESLK